MKPAGTTSGWSLQIDESPEWWFVTIGVQPGETGEVGLAETLWDAAAEDGMRRFVIELNRSTLLTSILIGQLVLLHKRAWLESGVVRICGWSDVQYSVLEQMQLADRFPNYPTREAAVMGSAP